MYLEDFLMKMDVINSMISFDIKATSTQFPFNIAPEANGKEAEWRHKVISYKVFQINIIH